jgi:hypothetical protein
MVDSTGKIMNGALQSKKYDLKMRLIKTVKSKKYGRGWIAAYSVDTRFVKTYKRVAISFLQTCLVLFSISNIENKEPSVL